MFVDKFIKSEGGIIRILTAKEQGKEAWFVLRLEKGIYNKYKKSLNSLNMNICDYGTILDSGWGKLTPELKSKLQSHYMINDIT